MKLSKPIRLIISPIKLMVLIPTAIIGVMWLLAGDENTFEAMMNKVIDWGNK